MCCCVPSTTCHFCCLALFTVISGLTGFVLQRFQCLPETQRSACHITWTYHFALLLFSGAAHIWYGVLLAKVGEFEGPKATILNSFEVRDHFTRAAQINSRDALAHFLLGSWCLEIASISPLTRWWSSSLYADPPIATQQEALEHFLKADDCDPLSDNSVKNRMGIVKCCLALKQVRCKPRALQHSSVCHPLCLAMIKSSCEEV